MRKTRQGPAVAAGMLLCCLLALLAVATRPAAADVTPPPCPIQGPVVNVTTPGVLNINGTVSGIYQLAAGNYSLPASVLITTGTNICIKGAGRDSTVIVCASANHMSIRDNATLHLEALTLDGNNYTCQAITASQTGGTPAGPARLTSNALRITRSKAGLFISSYLFTAVMHDTEIIDQRAAPASGGAAIYAQAFSSRPIDITMSGTTTITRAVSSSGLGGAVYLQSSWTVGATVSLTFDGTSIISESSAQWGGGIYMSGAVTLRAQGPSFTLAGNRALGQGSGDFKHARGGAIAVGTYTLDAPPATIEFAANMTTISNNVADPTTAVSTATAEGAAVHVKVLKSYPVRKRSLLAATGNNAVLNILGPVLIANNNAKPNSAGFGGAVHLEATGGATATLNVAACVSFEANTVQLSNSSINYAGAALGLSNGAAADGSSERVIVSPAGKLLFGSNTIGANERDVSIAAEGAIVCNATSVSHGYGGYTVCGDLCAASCSVTSGGDCPCGAGNTAQSCAAGPSLDCTTQPANLANAAGWTCPSLANNAVCSAKCSGGFFGSPSATCINGSWSVTGGCAGCPAPAPSSSSTLITDYSSCTTAASAGSYAIGTRCSPICSAGSSGGFAICGQTGPAAAPSWQVTPCVAGCSTPPAAIPGVEWQCSGVSVTAAGGTCSGLCSTAAGLTGGPVTALCSGPLWSNSTTGSCTRFACIGNPPGSPANASFQCTSTPVGQACKATCNPGLSGGQRSECRADGSWGPLTGDSCVDCGAGKPRLEVMGPPASVPQGTTTVSATFTLTAPFITGPTTLAAKLDGLTPCTAQPAQLTGPQPTGTQIAVTCQIATGLSASLLHSITLTATYTGSNGCSSGSLYSTATVTVFQPPTPAPTVVLSAGDAAPSSCKAAAGKPTTATAVFTYAVTPAAGSTGLVLADPVISASAPGASCTSAQTGTLLAGQLTVSCSGVFDSLSSLDITATLNATTSGSEVGSATSNETVAFVCCTSRSGGGSGGSTAAGTVAQAIGTGDCQTCGTSPAAVEGVWLYGQLEAGVMRSGAVSPATCSSTGVDVGTISAVCDPDRPRVLRVKVVNPPGTAASKLQYLTRCNPLDAPAGVPCLEPNAPNTAAYTWKTALQGRDAFTVTTTPEGVVHEFAILQTSTDPNCVCSRFFFAIKQSGTFSLGPVSGTGNCPDAAAVKVASKTGEKKKKKKKAQKKLALSGRRLV